LKIGVLEAGAPPVHLREPFGRYGAMFANLLGPDFDYVAYDVQSGEMPSTAGDADAWVISGSAAGVYENHPWIASLEDFLRQARGQTPLIGVCFGHQILAQAFGGKVIKSPKGWAIGLQNYLLQESEPWMDPALQSVLVPASHQDQVVELPPQTRVLMSNDHCPNAALSYDDHPTISLQFHPEFAPDYAKALIESRRGSIYDSEQADAALNSLGQANDRERIADWMRHFLRAQG